MTASSMRARKGLPGKSDADVPKVLHPLLVLLIPVGEFVSIDGVLVGFGIDAEVGELVGEVVGAGVGFRVGEEVGEGGGSSGVGGFWIGLAVGEFLLPLLLPPFPYLNPFLLFWFLF